RRRSGRRLDGRSTLRAPRRLPAAARTGLAAALRSRAYGRTPRPLRRAHVEGRGMSVVEVIDNETGEILASGVDEICIRIRERWQDSAQAILDVGRMLIEAKERARHGEWQHMFSPNNPNRLPFNDGTARKLMQAARNSLISNRSHVNDLPPSW